MSTARIPIAAPLETRETARIGSYFTDSFQINCYVETQPDGRRFVVKRPGLVSAFTYNGGGASNGQGTTYYNSAIYAMGSNVLYRLSGSGNGSTDGSAWTASTSAPWAGRIFHQTIVFNGQVLVMGGVVAGLGSVVGNDVWASADLVNWRQLSAAAAWPGRKNFGAVVVGSTLFLMGGTNFGGGSTVYNDVWSSTDGVNWNQVVSSAAWSGRWGHQVVPFNQGMVLMGGKDSSGTLLNDVWFSPDGATWTELVVNASWSARYLFGAVVYNNKLWVIGGHAGAGTVATVYSSPDGVTWTNTGSLPAARESALTTVYAGKIWIVGGKSGATTFDQVYSTSDGSSFSTPSASYGGGAILGAGAIVWKTPTSVSAFNASTIWLVGGDAVTGSQIYRATLNVTRASSYSPSTGATTTEQWQSTTQNAGQYLVWKNTADAWVFYNDALQKITSSNYPQSTVSGVANLDDTVYVMDAAGVIYGSNLSDPFTWSSLNYITADYEPDTGIAIAKYGQSIVALKSTTTQFFYDAGRFPGSPLLPIVSANCRVGCVSANTVVSLHDNLLWVARTQQRGRFVAMLNGTTPVAVSTPAVDRILDAWFPTSQDTATAVRTNGHTFYFLTLGNSNLTLVYDLGEKQWWIARSLITFGNKLGASNYVTDGSQDYLQDAALGILYRFDPATYQDAGIEIDVTADGTLVDNNTNKRKFCGSLTVIGDRTGTSPNNATVSWSDDDGQTFSSGYTVDLTKPRPKVPRVGSFRRRRFKVTHSSNNPMRLEALELEIVS